MHAPGKADLNVYAYVHGQVLQNVDPLGLEGGGGGAGGTSGQTDNQSGAGGAPSRAQPAPAPSPSTGAEGTGNVSETKSSASSASSAQSESTAYSEQRASMMNGGSEGAPNTSKLQDPVHESANAPSGGQIVLAGVVVAGLATGGFGGVGLAIGAGYAMPSSSNAEKRPDLQRTPGETVAGLMAGLRYADVRADEIVTELEGAPESSASAGPASTTGSTSEAIQPYWSPNRGFMHPPVRQTLGVGTRMDRFGYKGGTFASPEGTPFTLRGLPPESASKPYNVYEVMKPLDVNAGTAAPAFGGGFGPQYELSDPVKVLLKSGHLRRVQ